ncbi:ABC transporter ATP-binding protein [Trueperella pyogenes]|uniref:ABC transporter ATP-binding protein n=1 Tax=Trueperella pyogenes TaxID=1661 RepID=UPI003243A44B
MDTLLSIEDLSVRIPRRKDEVQPLSGVNLTVGRGQTLGIVGESGSGKTMTALALMGLLPSNGYVSSGQITLDGRALVGMEDAELRKLRGTEIGMIFQDPMTSLNPTMTIGDQIGEPLRVHRGASKADAQAAAIDIMRRVGMPRPDKIVGDYPHQLSGGMRQRAMIAMALICRPKLLIADEPTTALDVTTQMQILDLIDDVKEEFGSSVILVTHDLAVVAGRADSVAVMYSGRVMEQAPARDLFTNPQHQYTRALLAALPERARTSDSELYSIPGSPPEITQEVAGCPFAPRCSFAQDICTTTTPLLGEATHKVACHFPGGEPLDNELEELAPNRVRNEAKPILKVRHVSRNFPAYGGSLVRRKIGTVSAVSDVSLTIYEGEVFGLVGESGCGKSTLGRLIAGLDEVSSGDIEVAGVSISALRGKERRKFHAEVQMMFQDSAAAMDPRMRVDEIILEPLHIQKVGSRAERNARVDTLVAQIGLPQDALSRYPHEFSGGQLQRIGLARALALNPRLIVCDEPVSALDVSVQAQVLNEMRTLQQKYSLAYIFISHDLSVVQYMSDRVAVMYLGKIVEYGQADDVALRPLHPYTKGLVDAVPRIEDAFAAQRTRLRIEGETPSAMNPPSGCRFRTRCPFARDICAAEEPQLRALRTCAGREQVVACHFPLVDS